MIDRINPISLASKAISTAATPLVAALPKIPIIAPSSYANIDLSKDVIVLFVPGTSNHAPKPELLESVKDVFGKTAALFTVDYAATWKFADSIPDGKRNLEEVLRFLAKKKRPGQKIYVVSESQGALISSDTLMKPEFYNVVDKTVLLGHPGIAHQHFHAKNPKFLEINNALDPATFEWRATYEEVTTAVDKFFRFDLTSIPSFVRILVRNPDYAFWLAVLQLERLDLLGKFIENPHDYSKKMHLAVLWLASDTKNL